jgi:hypothetical protein
MKIAPTIVFALSFLVAGCHTYDVNGDKPVRYANDVQIVLLDSTSRTITKSIQIFETPDDVKRSYHKIALLSRSGHREDEALILNAFAWRARQIGADGIIMLAPSRGWPDFQFRANAIVFDQP